MNTSIDSSEKPRKKRGAPKKPYPMVSTRLFVQPHLLEWAKHQPEGFAGLVRVLLREEYKRREP